MAQIGTRGTVWGETGRVGQLTVRQTDEEASGKTKGAEGEEIAKEDRVEEPMKERMFVTTDRLKMLPVRARTTRHDEERGASANANHQLSETQPPLAQVEVPSPPPGPPAKPMVPRGSFRTLVPTCILLSHLLDTLRARRILFPSQPLSVEHAPPHMVSSLPCLTRCSIHHRHWADRHAASTLCQPL